MTLSLFGSTTREDRGALVSACGRFRWRLWRRWETALPTLVFIMLNPSTADGHDDDPTIRRCRGFAQDLGYGGIEVVNLFPWRATEPADLAAAVAREGHDVVACREERDRHILEAAQGCFEPIAAWGAHPLADPEWTTLPVHLGSLRCLGRSMSGAPRHPLYLPRAARPQPWPAVAPEGPR